MGCGASDSSDRRKKNDDDRMYVEKLRRSRRRPSSLSLHRRRLRGSSVPEGCCSSGLESSSPSPSLGYRLYMKSWRERKEHANKSDRKVVTNNGGEGKEVSDSDLEEVESEKESEGDVVVASPNASHQSSPVLLSGQDLKNPEESTQFDVPLRRSVHHDHIESDHDHRATMDEAIQEADSSSDVKPIVRSFRFCAPRCDHSLCQDVFTERVRMHRKATKSAHSVDDAMFIAYGEAPYAKIMTARAGPFGGVFVSWMLNRPERLAYCEFFVEVFQAGINQIVQTRGTPFHDCAYRYFSVDEKDGTELHLTDRIIGEDSTFFMLHPCRRSMDRMKEISPTFIRVWTFCGHKVVASKWFEYPCHLNIGMPQSCSDDSCVLRPVPLHKYPAASTLVSTSHLMEETSQVKDRRGGVAAITDPYSQMNDRNEFFRFEKPDE
eukprot:TRINITY_DN28243_c0_g1_i1.p1 TRINITY_DN28243_c0_g1~~TRINITY_DN28243_c0_g1_i1.p1  ORF type:complete len:435 (+),score=113.41 TRINITY_DN28243_c0_g1_i1:333-1637(+)